jgi:hypothetical protein
MEGAELYTEVKHLDVVPDWMFISVLRRFICNEPVVAGVE